MTYTLKDMRDELAHALVEQDILDALYSEARADLDAKLEALETEWRAEMAPLIQRREAGAARVSALELDARAEIQATVALTGALPEMIGLGFQWRTKVEYNADELLDFARAHAPSLLRSALITDTAIKNWLDKQPLVVDTDSGERVRVLDGVAVPVAVVHVITPTVSRTALKTLEDERRWNEAAQS